MPLPQQVISQLTREPVKTPGWSSGILLFSGMMFFLMVIIYFIFSVGYMGYLNGKDKDLQGQITQVAQSISSDDQAKLVTFYSQITNLRTVLQNHILFSQFLDWLSKNTELNITYTQLTFSSGSQVTLGGLAKSESDINQQVAIFEASPQVKSANVTKVGLSDTGNTYTFNITLAMNPSIFKPQVTATPVVTTATSTQ